LVQINHQELETIKHENSKLWGKKLNLKIKIQPYNISTCTLLVVVRVLVDATHLWQFKNNFVVITLVQTSTQLKPSAIAFVFLLMGKRFIVCTCWLHFDIKFVSSKKIVQRMNNKLKIIILFFLCWGCILLIWVKIGSRADKSNTCKIKICSENCTKNLVDQQIIEDFSFRVYHVRCDNN
jgi:hypothetical protein